VRQEEKKRMNPELMAMLLEWADSSTNPLSHYEKCERTKKKEREADVTLDFAQIAQEAGVPSSQISDVWPIKSTATKYVSHVGSCFEGLLKFELTDGTLVVLVKKLTRLDTPVNPPAFTDEQLVAQENSVLDEFYQKSIVALLRAPIADKKFLKQVSQIRLVDRFDTSFECAVKRPNSSTIRSYRSSLREAINDVNSSLLIWSELDEKINEQVEPIKKSWYEYAEANQTGKKKSFKRHANDAPAKKVAMQTDGGEGTK